MKIKAELNKILKSWVGIVFFIIVGMLILYFFVRTTSIVLYLLVIIGVLLIYNFKKEEVLPYIYGGIICAILAHLILSVALSTTLPIVAVVSTSMQHDRAEITHYKWLEENLGYNRSYIESWPFPNGISKGDMPVVMGSDNYKIGDIIVYDARQDAPIIHRIIKVNEDGTYQTKGDNNPHQNPYEFSVKKEQIYGKVIFIIPKLGYLKVFITQMFGRF